MKLVLISPPGSYPDEIQLLDAIFQAGLTRYDLRKPDWPSNRVAAWLEALPGRWRERVWLHSHHLLAADFRVGGVHYQDRPISMTDSVEAIAIGYPTSRSCHDLVTLRTCLGQYDSVLFGPIFSSVSKAGHGPLPTPIAEGARAILAARPPEQRRALVYALSGITPENVSNCFRLGFEGVAAIGSVWNTPDPVTAFLALQAATRVADPVANQL